MSDELPLNRQEAILQLQQATRQLQEVLEILRQEEEETTTVPASVLVQLVATVTTLSQSVPLLAEPSQLEDIEITSEDLQGVDRLLPTFNRLQSLWLQTLSLVRRFLPKQFNEKLSNWALTAVISGVIIAVLLAAVLVVPRSPAPAALETVSPLEPTPLVSPAPAPALPPTLEAPEPPQRIDLAPPAEPTLTPEQNLLAFIQQELGDLTQAYPQDLILSIEPDFDHQQLIITLGKRWFELAPSKQAVLANNLWQRSQKLAFTKLTLLSEQGAMLARNPVVGDEMILWHRTSMPVE